MTTIRTFIAIPLPSFPTLEKLIDDMKHLQASVKLVASNNLHLTLKFLGDIQEHQCPDIIQKIHASASEFQPFTLNIQGCGVFPNRKYLKVLWVGITPPGIVSTLASTLDQQLSTIGFQRETRSFSPHLTIGRVKSSNQKENILTIINTYNDAFFGTVEVKTVHFIKSTLTPQGPIYTTLDTIELQQKNNG